MFLNGSENCSLVEHWTDRFKQSPTIAFPDRRIDAPSLIDLGEIRKRAVELIERVGDSTAWTSC
jgi:hypothetical protein